MFCYLDVFTGRNTVGDVEVNEFGREVHGRRQPVHYFHGVLHIKREKKGRKEGEKEILVYLSPHSHPLTSTPTQSHSPTPTHPLTHTSDISIDTSTEKYSVICEDDMSLRRTSMAMRGLFSTRSGSRFGVSPQWYTSFGSPSSSLTTCCG